MPKFKFALVKEEDYREGVKRKMKEFVEERWLQGKKTTLQDIQNVFQKPPYNLSEPTVRKYLKELVKNRKLSTYYKNGRRYYAPPKISSSIKFGAAVAIVIIITGLILDMSLPREYISKYVYLYNPELDQNQTVQTPSMLPIVIHLLILTTVFTVFAYWVEKKK